MRIKEEEKNAKQNAKNKQKKIFIFEIGTS